MNGNVVLNSPITISIALAMAGLIGVGVLSLIAHKLGMQKHLKPALKWIFSFNGVFWMANIACMAYSAQNAGYIFGLYEWTGYAVGIIIDLLIIVFTQVMMMAKARGERERAGKILLFIVFCCALSLVGNVAHNLHMTTTIQKQDDLGGVWFNTSIPYVAAVMPLFLIALAWVKDLKVDPLEFEDPVKYAEGEKKRLQYMRTQVSSRQKRAALDAQMIAIEKVEKQNKQLRKGKLPKSFRWPWEQPLAVDAILAQLTTQLQAGYEVKVDALVEEIETLRSDMGRQQKEQQMMPLSETQMSQPLIHPVSPADDRERQLADERFLDGIDDGIDDGDDDLFDELEINTGDQESVNIQVTPQSRITVKLDEYHAKQERNTDALKLIKKASTKRTSNPEGEAVKSIRRLLKRNPDMAPVDIAKKVGVSRQYASKIKSQVINELAGAGK